MIVSVFRMKTKHLINVPQFDEEHRQLFEITDLLRRELVKPDNLQAAQQAIVVLDNHTRIHFTNEERVMQQCGYPGYYDHRRIHLNLLAQLGEMARQLDGRQVFAVKSFNTSIAIWLTGHIISEDAKLGRYIQAQHQQMRAAAAAPAPAAIFIPPCSAPAPPPP